MKMKLRIPQRILSLLLALVLVVGMMPRLALNAEAASSGTFKCSGLTYTATLQKYEYQGTDKTNSTTINTSASTPPSRTGNNVTFRARVESWRDYSFTETDCTKALNTTVKYESQWSLIEIKVTRPAASHTGGTCADNSVCTRCGAAYVVQNNHSWGEWESNGDGTHTRTCNNNSAHKENGTCSGGTATCVAPKTCSTCNGAYGTADGNNHSWDNWTTANGRHIRTCKLNTNHQESGDCDHKAATCLAASVCSICKHTYEAQKDHSYTYDVSDKTITERCLNGCGHTATATLSLDPSVSLTYTGEEIKPLKVTYTGDWKNGTLNVYYEKNINAGKANGSISAGNDYVWATVSHNFTIQPRAITGVTATGYSGSYDGEAHSISVSGVPTGANVMYRQSVDGEWSFDNPTFTEPGTYTVYYEVSIVSWPAGTTNEVTTGSATVTITKPNISDATVTLTPENGTYTGNAYTPAVSVSHGAFGTLVEDTHYTVSWDKTGFTAPDTYTVTVTGIGNFTGEVTKTFTIGKADPTAELFQFELPQNAAYNGTAYSANVSSSAPGLGAFTVKYNGSADAPKNAGTYKVTVDVAEGSNYNAATGIELGSFTIAPIAGSATVTVADVEYGDPVTPAPTSTTNGVDNVTYLYKAQGADDSTYTSEVPTAVGSYTVKATFAATQNHKEVTATDDFTISKRAVTVTAKNASKTYGGADPEALTWSVTSGTELASEPLAISISRAEGENAGDYTITVSQTDGANPNYAITFVDGTFTINKAKLTVTAQNETATYGDAIPAYTVTYSGFVNEESKAVLGGTLAFDCDYVQFADKGNYAITPSGLTSSNYDITYTSGKLTVSPKKITVTIADKTSVYGEEIVELAATADGIVNGDTNVYTLATTATKTSNVGEYPITGTRQDDNYDITFANGTYTITKANAAFTAPTANTLTYNGENQALIAAGSTNDGTMVYSLEKEGTYAAELPKAMNAGTYNVWYKVVGDGNHTDSAPASVQVEIAKADPGIGAVTAGVVNDTLETSAIVLTRENNTVPGALTVDAGQTLALGENIIRYTFLPTDTTNYKSVTNTVTVIVKDTIAPTGTVTISTNSWNQFLNDITFGLFFKQTQTVSVSASDNLSGVAKIEYIESKTAMDLDAVKAVEQWTEMKNGSVSITLEDAKQFIYYIRITDKSGNVAYLSTDGAEYDTTAPVIEGVDNGKTYYTTQTVTVTDKNIDTITLNGEAVTGSITLEGNKEATYTIVATDKVGNSTTVTVKMAPISDITGSMEGKTADNVTSDDKTNLQAIVDTATELLQDEDITAEEKTALEKAKADAEALIEVIDDTAAEQKAVTDKAAEFDEDAVKSTDKAELEKLAEDIEALLDTDNLTQDERTALETLLEQVEGMIDTIDETAADIDAATDAIDALDPETVKSTDKETVEEALETIEELLDGDHLTDTERDALEDAKADAEALLDAIEEAAKAIDTENTAKVEDVTAENVTPEDKSDLENAKADLEKALEDNSGNYTEEEKQAIQDDIDRIDDALEVIENVEEVEEIIDDLPATVEPDDEETVAKIEDAKKAYDELTEYEKSLVDKKIKEKLDDLTAAAVDYKIVKGDGGRYTVGSGKTLSFTANGPVRKFDYVQVNGKTIAASNYTVTEGSTIITLKSSYLDKLGYGKHKIQIFYTDGSTNVANFRIYVNGENPFTGDDSHMMLLGGVAMVSLLCMAMMFMFIPRKKGKYQR